MPDDRLRRPVLALGKSFPDTEYRLKSRGLSRLELAGNYFSGFTVQRATLRVTHDNVAATHVPEHARRHLAGVGSGYLSRQVLGTQQDSATSKRSRHVRQVHEWGAN